MQKRLEIRVCYCITEASTLENWVALVCLFLLFENSCRQNSCVGLPDLRDTSGASTSTRIWPSVLKYECSLWGSTLHTQLVVTRRLIIFARQGMSLIAQRAPSVQHSRAQTSYRRGRIQPEDQGNGPKGTTRQSTIKTIFQTAHQASNSLLLTTGSPATEWSSST